MPQRYARRPLRVAVGALALIAALVLSACAPSGPDIIPLTVEPSASSGAAGATPTPTPLIVEPYVTPAPQSTSEAIRYASGALQNYLDVSTAIMGNPADADGLAVLAAGAALEDDQHTAAQLAERGAYLEGSVTFNVDVASSFVEDVHTTDGTVIEPFGMVTLEGCQDQTRLTGTNGDGTPMRLSGAQRAIANGVLLYSSTDGTWLVFQLDLRNGEVTPC